MKKTLLLLILSGALTSILYAQQINPDFAKYSTLKKNGSWQTTTKSGKPLGYIPPVYKPNFSNYQKPIHKGLPIVYDLRDLHQVTSPKNQGNCGACWAFTTMGAIESNWLTLGYNEHDLSEQNLRTCHGFLYEPCDGGNSYIAAAYLTRFDGPISETDDQFDENENATCKTEVTPVAYVKEFASLPADADVLKQIIIEHGAIYTAMCWNDTSFNEDNNTYYYTGNDPANHAVLLIGWNDTLTTQGGKGAWIIKNSWGNSWGDNGYFYISYNDTRILDENAIFINRSEYNSNYKIYSYNEVGHISDTGFVSEIGYGLVKFTPDKANHQLMQIGTFVNTVGTIISIEIYDTLISGSLAGLLASTQPDTFDLPGYYVIDLPNAVTLKKGNDFYVKVKYITPSYFFPIPYESAYPDYASPKIESNVCWISNDGITWVAVGNNIPGAKLDLTIKAYSTLNDLSLTITKTDISCNGLANGSATATVSGGKSPYTYLWNTIPSQTSNIISNLSAKTYKITVTDSKGLSITDSIKINEPVGMSFITQTSSNVTCFGKNNGTITVEVTGGTSPYTYNIGTGNKTTGIFTNLNPLSYKVTVTDNKGCTKESNSFLILQPFELTVNLTVTDISTPGGNDGSIEVTVNGGTPSYRYSWNTGETTKDIGSLLPGGYIVTVTDANSCTTSKYAVVNDPSNPCASLTITGTTANISCYGKNDGAITINILGGTSPYSYLWSNGRTTKNLQNLTVNTYTITVSDNGSCTNTKQFILTQPGSVIIEAGSNRSSCSDTATMNALLPSTGKGIWSVIKGNAIFTNDTLPNTFVNNLAPGENILKWATSQGSCNYYDTIIIYNNTPSFISPLADVYKCEGQDAVFYAKTTGTGITYLWQKDGTPIPESNTDLLVVSKIKEANEGTYQCIAWNGCDTIESNSVKLIINNPKILNHPVSIVSCPHNSEVFSVTATGQGLYYRWMKNGNVISDATSPTLELPNISLNDAGIYKCQVYTSCNLINSNEAELLFNMPQITTHPKNELICENDTAIFTVTATGNNLAYQWYKNDNEPITAQTNSSLIIPNVKKSDMARYKCRIVNECDTIYSNNARLILDTITIINQPQSISACEGNYVAFYANAEGNNLAFQWKKNGVIISSATSAIYSLDSITVADTATYTCEISNNCYTIETAPATLKVSTASILSHPLNAIKCIGDTITFTVSAIGNNLTYQWSKNGNNITNATNTSFTLNNITPNDAGTYLCKVTNSCYNLFTTPANLSVDEISVWIEPIGDTNKTCIGKGITHVVGGISPYSYLWNDNAHQTTQTATGLCIGTYWVTVIDANGCSATDSARIDTLLNIASINSIPNILIYPNPVSNGCVTIKFENYPYQSATITIYDIAGRKLFTKQYSVSNSEIILPVNTIATGIYHLNISNDTTTIINKKLLISD